MQPKTAAGLASTGVALLLVLAFWILPLMLTPAESIRFVGEKHAIDMDLSTSNPRTFAWEYEVKAKDPRDFHITPALPWNISIQKPDTSELAFVVAICIYVNGQQVSFSSDAPGGLPERCLYIGSSATGRVSSKAGDPLPKDMPQSQFRSGVNQIRVEATARATQPAPDSTVHLELGPVRSVVVARDANHDSVADAYQPIPVHAGVSAAALGVIGGILAYTALGRWLKSLSRN